jgi:hypothetical protein
MLDKLKGCYKSVVIWFNGLALSFVSLFDLFHESLPELSQYVPDNIYKKVGLAIIIGNLLLRFKTSKALQDK